MDHKTVFLIGADPEVTLRVTKSLCDAGLTPVVACGAAELLGQLSDSEPQVGVVDVVSLGDVELTAVADFLGAAPDVRLIVLSELGWSPNVRPFELSRLHSVLPRDSDPDVVLVSVQNALHQTHPGDSVDLSSGINPPSVPPAEDTSMHRLELVHRLTGLASRLVDADLDDLAPVVEESLSLTGQTVEAHGGFLCLDSQVIPSAVRCFSWQIEIVERPLIPSLLDLRVAFPPSVLNRLQGGHAVRIVNSVDSPSASSGYGDWLQSHHFTAMILVPLTRGDGLLGVLGLFTVNQVREWQEDDVVFLAVVAEILASSIYGRQAVLRMQRQSERVSFVNDLGRLLATAVDVDSICNIVYSKIGHVLDLAHLFIGEYDAEEGTIRAIFGIMDGVQVDVSGIAPAPLDPEKGQQTRAIMTRMPVITSDMPKHRREYKSYDHIPSPDPDDVRVPHSILTVPILLEGEVFGTLQIQSYQVGIYSEADAQLLGGAANQLGLAIANARLLERVREEIQRLQDVMETVPEGLLLVGADGQLLMANPVGRAALKNLSDAPIDDKLVSLGGRPWTEFLSPSSQEQWHELSVLGEETVDGLPGKAERIYEVSARPLVREGRTRAWVVVVRDVTHEREIQQRVQQQDRLAAVGQLAAGIAHDFNNIMAVIVLYAQMLQRDQSLPVGARERLATVVDQAHHASNLITQILDFSRSSTLDALPLDLGVFLKEIARLLNRTLPESISVELIKGTGSYVVEADPTQIQQAIMNLAVNSRDAMPSGGSFRLELDVLTLAPSDVFPLPELEPGRYVTVKVSDTGLGISKKDLPRVFDPFFTTKPFGQGTGLGLAQVHGIVKQHQGEVTVSSTPGIGTTFTIYLPALLLPSEGPAGGCHEYDARLALPRGSSELVLVVEDNVGARASVSEALQMLNYRTLEAADGHEALSVCRARLAEISLIITDLVMPRLGGRGLIEALVSQGVDTPIIVLSGYGYGEEALSLAELGITDHLQKPIDLASLAGKVSDVLSRKSRVSDDEISPGVVTEV